MIALKPAAFVAAIGCLLLAFLLLAMTLEALPPQDDGHVAHSDAAEGPAHIDAPISPDERIANYTYALVWLTGVLAGVALIQFWFLHKANKAALTAADATAETVREMKRQFNATYRARVIARTFSISPINKTPLRLAFMVVNHGDTDCYITEYNAILYWSNLPPGMLEFGEPPIDKRHIRLQAGGAEVVIAEMPALPSEHAITKILSGEFSLYVYGYVVYVDDNKVVRRTGFVRMWDRNRNAFNTHRNEDYEYQD